MGSQKKNPDSDLLHRTALHRCTILPHYVIRTRYSLMSLDDHTILEDESSDPSGTTGQLTGQSHFLNRILDWIKSMIAAFICKNTLRQLQSLKLSQRCLTEQQVLAIYLD